MKASSRHAAPVRVTESGVTQLVRDNSRREAFIQNLVHNHPEVLPMVEIEPAFSPLIPVCKELPTPAGYVDNLWLTPAGGVVIGECKLVRNPQARREVLAQCLDYARAIARWSYDDLQAAVGNARGHTDLSLWSLVESHPDTDLNQEQFADAIERRLRTGRILILIIGDGIQEGVEALTEHLQMHAGIHAGLALVDLSVWSDPAGGLIVVPRVPMRTVLVERGIVTFDPSVGVSIDPPKTAIVGPSAGKAVTASEPEFYAQLDQRRPGLAGPLRAFLESAAEIGIEPIYRKTVVLRFKASPDIDVSAGYVENNGRAWFYDPFMTAQRLGYAKIGEAYLQDVAAAAGGRVYRKDAGSNPTVFGADNKALDVAVLLQNAAAWRQAIGDFADAMRSANG